MRRIWWDFSIAANNGWTGCSNGIMNKWWRRSPGTCQCHLLKRKQKIKKLSQIRMEWFYLIKMLGNLLAQCKLILFHVLCYSKVSHPGYKYLSKDAHKCIENILFFNLEASVGWYWYQNQITGLNSEVEWSGGIFQYFHVRITSILI